MTNNNSWYRKLLVNSSIVATIILGANNIGGKSVEPNPILIKQQEDIASKVGTIYSRTLSGDKCSTNQSEIYLFEIDVQKYNLRASENNDYLTIYTKERGNRQGFFDKNVDGIPEIYIDILVYPNTPNATEITREVIELYKSTENKKNTTNGEYIKVTDDNRAEIKAKYEKIVDEIIKDDI